MDKINPIKKTSDWISHFVVKNGICPFAKESVDLGLVHLSYTDQQDSQKLLDFFKKELALIEKASPKEISNSFLIFPNASLYFNDFLDFYYICESKRKKIDPHSSFQIVCFHPKFLFENLKESARINWVNRSPFPSIHILRSSEVERAVKSTAQGEMISTINEKYLKNLSEEQFSKIKSFLK